MAGDEIKDRVNFKSEINTMHIIRVALGIVVSTTCLDLSATSAVIAEDENWTLVWADEFDAGKTSNSNSWVVIEGNGCPTLCGFGNEELQTYTAESQNLRIEDGKLIIEAHYDDTYTSAKITSQKMPGWQTGKIAMRARLPKGVGTWPAFWMLPDVDSFGAWPKSGEIDIMEHVGHREGYIHGTIHTEAYNHKIGTQKGGEIFVPNAASGFHDYSLEWTSNSLRWLVDGEKYFEIDRMQGDASPEWPFDQPFHIILNLAVGGFWGGEKGVVSEDFPARYEVDWVRVWQQK